MVPAAAVAVASTSQFVSIFERRFSFRFFAIFPSFFSVALRCGLPSVLCQCVCMSAAFSMLTPAHTHTLRHTHRPKPNDQRCL